MRRFIVGIVAALTATAAGPIGAEEQPLQVVASFSVLADMAARIGGDDVTVASLVGAGADPHAWHPGPRDVRRLAEAELLVVNGLGFEGWLDRLIETSGYAGPVVVASRGITALRGATGMADPHAWHSLDAARRYAANIAEALGELRPGSAASFASNLSAFDAALDELADWADGALSVVPPGGRVVVTTHDAFAYLGHDYGIRFLAPVGVDSAAQPSARRLADLVETIRAAGVRAVFAETGEDPRLARVLADEAGITVGGRLYAGTLSGAGGPAATYLDMWRHNFALMTGAMSR